MIKQLKNRVLSWYTINNKLDRAKQEILGHEIAADIERKWCNYTIMAMSNKLCDKHVCLVMVSAVLIVSLIINIAQAVT